MPPVKDPRRQLSVLQRKEGGKASFLLPAMDRSYPKKVREGPTGGAEV